MVKLFCPNIVARLTFLIVFATTFAGCQDKWKAPWRLDSKYSDYLTTMAWDYKMIAGHGSANTVDGMLIYKIGDKIPNGANRIFSLEELFERDILYESRDKEFIRKFLEAAQDEVKPTPTEACQIDWNEASLHVILLDNTFMRAGYFIFRTCKNADNGTVFTMRFTHYRTKSLVPLIRAIDPVLHHDPQLPLSTR
ncbi:MAG: hypothetical protein EXR70_00245 [Deltaproteobacteria bacterium]|nr:hypothetical protein [Deltaproteobacteria bacterium]